MRVFIFAGLLACIHGLGDRAQYTNIQNNVWTAVGQAAGSWQLNTCLAGTAQSPIDIVTATATAPAPALPPLVATGHDQDLPVRLDIDGNPGLPAATAPVAPVATGLRMTPVTANQAVISGGPLTGRLVCLKFFSIAIFLTLCLFTATPSPTPSSTGEMLLALWVLSTQSTGRGLPWRCSWSTTGHNSRPQQLQLL